MALNIKKAIKEKGLTSIEVAKRMGITTVGLSQHINGNPSVDTLERIAKAIEIDISELIDKIQVGSEFNCPHCGNPIKINLTPVG